MDTRNRCDCDETYGFEGNNVICRKCGDRWPKIRTFALDKLHTPTSVNRLPNGNHSYFWRELSWRCGDEHANRICKWVDFYCWLFKLDRERFYRSVPR